MKIIFSLLIFTINSIGFSQSQIKKYNPVNNQQSNINRYKKDYQLVNENLLGIDSTILNEINLKTIDSFRKEDEDIIINYRELNVDIIIYSRQKAIVNKAFITTPLNKSH